MSGSLFTEEYEEFVRLLVEARSNANMTQDVVAKKLGRPQSFVSKYESGQRRLDVVEFVEVSKAIGIDPAEVIEQVSKAVEAISRMDLKKVLEEANKKPTPIVINKERSTRRRKKR